MHCMAQLTSQLTFRVPDEVYELLQTVATGERRKMNEVARALLVRGIAAYNADGWLFDDGENGGDNGEKNMEPGGPPERPMMGTVSGPVRQGGSQDQIIPRHQRQSSKRKRK